MNNKLIKILITIAVVIFWIPISVGVTSSLFYLLDIVERLFNVSLFNPLDFILPYPVNPWLWLVLIVGFSLPAIFLLLLWIDFKMKKPKIKIWGKPSKFFYVLVFILILPVIILISLIYG